MTKPLSYHAGNREKALVLMLATTGVAAVNIAGLLFNLLLASGHFRRNILKLNYKSMCKLRNPLSSVKVILIDEILMVSNTLLLHIH